MHLSYLTRYLNCRLLELWTLLQKNNDFDETFKSTEQYNSSFNSQEIFMDEIKQHTSNIREISSRIKKSNTTHKVASQHNNSPPNIIIIPSNHTNIQYNESSKSKQYQQSNIQSSPLQSIQLLCPEIPLSSPSSPTPPKSQKPQSQYCTPFDSRVIPNTLLVLMIDPQDSYCISACHSKLWSQLVELLLVKPNSIGGVGTDNHCLTINAHYSNNILTSRLDIMAKEAYGKFIERVVRSVVRVKPKSNKRDQQGGNNQIDSNSRNNINNKTIIPQSNNVQLEKIRLDLQKKMIDESPRTIAPLNNNDIYSNIRLTKEECEMQSSRVRRKYTEETEVVQREVNIQMEQRQVRRGSEKTANQRDNSQKNSDFGSQRNSQVNHAKQLGNNSNNNNHNQNETLQKNSFKDRVVQQQQLQCNHNGVSKTKGIQKQQQIHNQPIRPLKLLDEQQPLLRVVNRLNLPIFQTDLHYPLSYRQSQEDYKILVVAIHGYRGSPDDFRLMKNFMKAMKSTVDFVTLKNQKNNPAASIQQLSMICAEELITVLSDRPFINCVHVLAFSMGGLIARRMVHHLGDKRKLLSVLLTISSPHLGAAMSSSCRIQTAMKVIGMVTKDQCYKDMINKTPFIRDLAASDELKAFKRVIFVGSPSDLYVSEGSALAQINSQWRNDSCFYEIGNIFTRNNQKGSLQNDGTSQNSNRNSSSLRNDDRNMAPSYKLNPVSNNTNSNYPSIQRISVQFQYDRPNTCLQWLTGRATHIRFLADISFAQAIMHLFATAM